MMEKRDFEKKGFQENSEDIEESEIFNQRFIELLQSKQEPSEQVEEI